MCVCCWCPFKLAPIERKLISSIKKRRRIKYNKYCPHTSIKCEIKVHLCRTKFYTGLGHIFFNLVENRSGKTFEAIFLFALIFNLIYSFRILCAQWHDTWMAVISTVAIKKIWICWKKIEKIRAVEIEHEHRIKEISNQRAIIQGDVVNAQLPNKSNPNYPNQWHHG